MPSVSSEALSPYLSQRRKVRAQCAHFLDEIDRGFIVCCLIKTLCSEKVCLARVEKDDWLRTPAGFNPPRDLCRMLCATS
jgi:hypothetical protein